jgi:hypothetical protein
VFVETRQIERDPLSGRRFVGDRQFYPDFTMTVPAANGFIASSAQSTRLDIPVSDHAPRWTFRRVIGARTAYLCESVVPNLL